jgi:NAD(P)-dependent dehydrogenase (short-subunit alcohol dehydrogenase family)
MLDNTDTAPHRSRSFRSKRARTSGGLESNGVRMVIGASRGIGLALVETQLDDPDVNCVIATCRPSSNRGELERLSWRHGPRLVTRDLDVADEASLKAFAHYMSNVDGGVDLTIHAAGLLHDTSLAPERSLLECSTENLRRLFEVNSIGPLMVARALLPSLHRSRRFTFAAISAMVGSIGDNRLGGWYGYRASKTALNQFIRTLANESRMKHPRASVVAIHPGTTDTQLSRPFQRNIEDGKLFSPEQTAKRILDVLGSIDHEQTGQFFNWDGSIIPW